MRLEGFEDGKGDNRPLYLSYISFNRWDIFMGSTPLGVTRDDELSPPSL